MSEQNTAVVQRCYAAFGRGDLDGVIAELDPSIEWITPGSDDIPHAGTRRGHAAVREFFRIINETYQFDRFEAQTFVAQGDLVVVLGEDGVTVKATGKSISEAWAHVFTVKNGKIVRFQEYIDLSTIAADLRVAAARA